MWHGESIDFKSMYAGSNICTPRTDKFKTGISWRNSYLRLIHIFIIEIQGRNLFLFLILLRFIYIQTYLACVVFHTVASDKNGCLIYKKPETVNKYFAIASGEGGGAAGCYPPEFQPPFPYDIYTNFLLWKKIIFFQPFSFSNYIVGT